MLGIGKKRVIVRQYIAKNDKELNKRVEKDANKLAGEGYRQISVSRIDTLPRSQGLRHLRTREVVGRSGVRPTAQG